MSQQVNTSPALPRPVDADQWKQVLVSQLQLYLSDLARRANACLPADGQEPFTGTLVVTGGIAGVTDASAAAAGVVGEVLSNTGAGVALTTATAANVTSLALTAGDWDVWGAVGFTPGATTSITLENQSLSLTSASLDGTPGQFTARIHAAIVPGASSNNLTMSPVMFRVNVAAPTTVYLVARANFTVSTLSAFGEIRARRRR